MGEAHAIRILFITFWDQRSQRKDAKYMAFGHIWVIYYEATICYLERIKLAASRTGRENYSFEGFALVREFHLCKAKERC